jgi:hypothetical protein
MACVRYITETKIFVANSSTDSNCNSILFINTGSVSVTVENVLLQAGQQLAIDGNRDEMNIKTYYFTFAAGANPQLTVVYKRYVG